MMAAAMMISCGNKTQQTAQNDAADGYPQLFPTLAATEAHLQECLHEDQSQVRICQPRFQPFPETGSCHGIQPIRLHANHILGRAKRQSRLQRQRVSFL